MIGGDGKRSISVENPLWSGPTRVAIFMPAGLASGDIALRTICLNYCRRQRLRSSAEDTKYEFMFNQF